MNTIMAESNCTKLWDIAQTTKNDRGKPGTDSKCLLTVPEMLCVWVWENPPPLEMH